MYFITGYRHQLYSESNHECCKLFDLWGASTARVVHDFGSPAMPAMRGHGFDICGFRWRVYICLYCMFWRTHSGGSNQRLEPALGSDSEWFPMSICSIYGYDESRVNSRSSAAIVFVLHPRLSSEGRTKRGSNFAGAKCIRHWGRHHKRLKVGASCRLGESWQTFQTH